jgi:outer membrane lipoprotein-sorting protein
MKRLILIPILFLSVFSNAQDQDPKAKSILDEVSALVKGYKSIQADAVFTIVGKDKKVVDKPQAWKIQVKGQKFRLEIPGTSILSDGKTLWNYNKDAKEVTIKNFDPSSDEMNPAKIFTIYESGYKYKYEKEEKIGPTACHVIALYPSVKPERKKFHTAKIYIDKTKKQIVRMVMFMKDGGTQTYDIKAMKTNVEMPDNLFTFDTKGLKPDQINDERDL